MQAEGVVAPGDVAQAFLDPPVVLGVDDLLLAVVGPGMRAGRAERRPARLGEREQPPAALALLGEGLLPVGPGTRDDLDLRGDQLARDPAD